MSRKRRRRRERKKEKDLTRTNATEYIWRIRTARGGVMLEERHILDWHQVHDVVGKKTKVLNLGLVHAMHEWV